MLFICKITESQQHSFTYMPFDFILLTHQTFWGASFYSTGIWYQASGEGAKMTALEAPRVSGGDTGNDN